MIALKTKKKSGHSVLARKQNFYAYLFILPAFIFLFMFLFMPISTAFVKSFYRYDTMSVNQFIGFKNYVKLFTQDPKFWKSMLLLLYYFVGLIVCFFTQIITAKFTQSVVNMRLQKIFRAAFIVPMVVPGVITLMMWKFIYYPGTGVIARIAAAMGMAQSPNLLGNAKTVNAALIFAGFPWVAGTSFIILYSAFQGVEKSLTESAAIDGATGIKTFFLIELPTIMPQLKVLFVYAIIGLVQQYEKNLIMTNGGPNNASLLPGLHMYKLAFGGTEPQFGYACAVCMILFVVTMVSSIFAMRYKEEQNG